jgi:hypothetical protein
LNHERAEEEKRGLIRWLRPEFQNPSGKVAQRQQELELPKAKEKKAGKAKKIAWPKALAEQVQAPRSTLAASAGPLQAKDLAGRFKNAKVDRITELLDAMEVLGQARQLADGRYAA